MAILVRIKLPYSSEYRKVIRTKKDNFVLLGDNYNIDFNCAYITTIYGGMIKIQCLDYEKGNENRPTDPQGTAIPNTYVRSRPAVNYPAYGIAPAGATGRIQRE